ncbi:hypothetical protein N7492_007706 [Penicillium capsulatum]|uniref:Uncharacterized protein n=1 Tax=Penicillium capsulatum TaxID=69766 RepID=A0A9W9I0F0_9EURO|nr:hypothetical protein N7492_007706 [Penicillium capsulatum]
MGLSVELNDGKPTFSSHVLQLEICGPDEDHVTVIDIPGIFRTTTEGRTTKADITVVRNMVLQYMRNPRSVILAVVPCNVDIATQDIIEMAKEVDPLGKRTLRILTKPDLVDEGAENTILNLIEAQNQTGRLGWIVVRNLGQRQLDNDDVDRDTEEMAFFQNPPWDCLRPENYGIKTLKSRLQEVLSTNVRRTFPLCDTPGQQRMLLLEAVAVFEDLARQGITANYAHEAFDAEEDLRYKFFPGAGDDVRDDESGGSEQEAADESAGSEQETADDPSVEVLSTRKTHDCEDTQHILHENQEIQEPIDKGVLPWIEEVYHRTRGLEIGSVNSSLLVGLMKRQSLKWAPLAYGFASDVVTIVHRFICKALEVSCGRRKVVEKVLNLLMESLLDKYRTAIHMADFNLEVEGEIPFTLNHYFNDNLTKLHEKRIQSEVGKKTVDIPRYGKMIRPSDITLHESVGNVQFTVQGIHDTLQAYYKVARKRFADNVPKHVAIHHLLMGKDAPMKLFAAPWVSGLSDEDLEDIAGESWINKQKRRQINKEIEDLEAGRKVL